MRFRPSLLSGALVLSACRDATAPSAAGDYWLTSVDGRPAPTTTSSGMFLTDAELVISADGSFWSSLPDGTAQGLHGTWTSAGDSVRLVSSRGGSVPGARSGGDLTLILDVDQDGRPERLLFRTAATR